MFDAVEWLALHFEDVPAIVVGCLEYAEPPRDAFLVGAGAGGEVWPAVQNLLLAARSLGIGSCPTTLGIRDRAAVQRVLGLPQTVVPLVEVTLGYPLGKFGPLSRRPLEEVLHWDRWS
jgi:nitroreductase